MDSGTVRCCYRRQESWSWPVSSQLSVGDLVSVSDYNDIERRQATSATVNTSQTTTSTSYTDLATVGPAVTVTTGTSALVIVSLWLESSGGTGKYASYAISGATTVAADDAWATSIVPTGASGQRVSVTHHHTGLTAGSNTFTMKYRVAAGTGTHRDRHIVVIPQD